MTPWMARLRRWKSPSLNIPDCPPGRTHSSLWRRARISVCFDGFFTAFTAGSPPRDNPPSYSNAALPSIRSWWSLAPMAQWRNKAPIRSHATTKGRRRRASSYQQALDRLSHFVVQLLQLSRNPVDSQTAAALQCICYHRQVALHKSGPTGCLRASVQ